MLCNNKMKAPIQACWHQTGMNRVSRPQCRCSPLRNQIHWNKSTITSVKCWWVMSLTCMFCLTNSPPPNKIQFNVINHKEKHQISVDGLIHYSANHVDIAQRDAKKRGMLPGRVETVSLSPYCLYVLIFQRELSVLGSNLVSLLVHHFFKLLHHLPLSLRHTWWPQRGDGERRSAHTKYKQAK